MRRVAIMTAALLVLLAPSAYANPRNDVVVPSGDAANAETIEDVEIPEADPETSDKEARLALEFQYATGFHPDANDHVGARESLYRGRWFVPRHDDRRRCIVKRESNGNYRAVSAGGMYRGAYQMNRALAIGATWEMQAEVRRDWGEEGLRIVRALREVPPDKWNRYWQDRAFWTIWSGGKGKHHWRGGAWKC